MKLNPFQEIANAAAQTPQTGGTPNPFADMLANMPQTGWARPEAQAYWQQAMQAPSVYGPAGSGTAAPNTGAPGSTPATGQTGYAPKLASEITASPEARKFLRQFRKAKKASDFGWDDAGMLAANVALGVATGGTSLAGQIAGGALGGATSLWGSDKANKAIAAQTGKIKKIRKQAMSELGYARGKGGDYVDAQGNKLGGANIFQLLMDYGYLGGGG